MPKRLLIVDDDTDSLLMLRSIFKESDYDVQTVDNGAEALKYAQQFAPDAILLDIMMPGMSGIDVFKHLRKDPRTLGIPIVFVTALDEKKYIKAAIQSGADHYITKPYDAEDLLSVVDRVTSKSDDPFAGMF